MTHFIKEEAPKLQGNCLKNKEKKITIFLIVPDTYLSK